ncbi:MAG TPA: patatin-like phospholipase family protein [Desulfomonilaceae bacterium]|nr:patatin-like phospholipase family protein [Desulfomonilaceae bacterium]
MNRGKPRIRRRCAEVPSTVGLVLSAGGARGAYQLGCWKAFITRGISFSAVAGSSIGALNGALVCQGDWEAAYRLWLELTRISSVNLNYRKLAKLIAGAAGDMGLLLLPVPNLGWLRAIKYASTVAKFASRHGTLGVLLKNGLFSMSGIKPVLKRHLDMTEVMARPMPLFVTVCGEPRAASPLGPSHWFHIQNQDEEDAWDYLTASMSVPFIFSPVRVRGEYYSDGGIGNWLPVAPLYENGIRNMIVVSTKANTTCKARDYPKSTIIVIRPQKPLGRFPVATFRFTEKAVENWMNEGYEDAMRVLDREGGQLGL